MDDSEQRKKHLDFLKIRYKISQDRTVSSESFLYLILRKAELGIEITEIEFEWLGKNSFFNAIRTLKELEQFRINDRKKLEIELLQLRNKYRIPENIEITLSSSIYSILWKLDTESTIKEAELKLLKDNNFTETVALIPDILNFSKLKIKYKATQYLSQLPEEPLYAILKKLDLKEQLSDNEANWLLRFDLDETLEFYWQQEEEKNAAIEFSELKFKYQVSSHPDISISSPLYSILKKIKAKQELDDGECKWLNQQKLTKLIEIDKVRKQKNIFAQLKSKYKATQDKNLDINSPLFDILRKLEINQVCETDIQWLAEKNFTETVKIAKQVHFIILKEIYRVIDTNLPMIPFYEIILKLERGERLEPKQSIQIMVKGRYSLGDKIVTAHYCLEAKFYEQEYQRTGNKWNLPSASSNWRKANKPQKALQVTKNIDWNKVKESKLKSALLVTRGGAFRDIEKFDDAEICAKQAMESQPDAYQPYTLMGALCYDRGKCVEGDKWFSMAVERGAKFEDIDDEIKKIVRMTKDKNKHQEIVKHLLRKDPKRYAWAKSI
jgi:hypothetical protein